MQGSPESPFLLGSSSSLPSAGSSWSVSVFLNLCSLFVFSFFFPFCLVDSLGSCPCGRLSRAPDSTSALLRGCPLLSQCLQWSSASSPKPGGHAGAAVSRGQPLVTRGPSASPGTPAASQALTGCVARATPRGPAPQHRRLCGAVLPGI